MKKIWLSFVLGTLLLIAGSTFATGQTTITASGHATVTASGGATTSGSSESNSGTMCTADYTPVCGKVQVQCVTAPCDPVWETFSNACTAHNAWATEIMSWACVTTGTNSGSNTTNGSGNSTVSGHATGCLASAGYSRDEATMKCVRSPILDALIRLQTAYEFALSKGITTMETLTSFRAEDAISRQEATKMFVNFAKAKLTAEARAKLDASTEDMKCEFSDKGLFGSTLADYVKQACKYGFVAGDTINGKKVFHPQGNLTRSQALAVLIRIIDKRADETIDPRYMWYVTKAMEFGLDLSVAANWDTPITRGDLIVWMNVLSEEKE